MENNIGIIGLAVMGENLVLNLVSKGFSVSCYDRFLNVTQNFLERKATGKKIFGYQDIEKFVDSLNSPRKIMLLVKAGEPVDTLIEQLISNFNETLRRK